MTTITNPSSIPAEWDRNLTTRDERYAAGKLRSSVSRSSHAEWAPDPERPDPMSILQEANKTRLRNWCLFALDHVDVSVRLIEEQPTSWRTTCRRRLSQASRRRSVVMRISATSVSLPLQSAGGSSM